jgi:UDP-N-acetyl-D-mannosaminuronic acid dehydrogenase
MLWRKILNFVYRSGPRVFQILKCKLIRSIHYWNKWSKIAPHYYYFCDRLLVPLPRIFLKRGGTFEEKEHSVNQLRVVGGVCDCCLEAALQFYNGVSSSSSVAAVGGVNGAMINGNNNNEIVSSSSFSSIQKQQHHQQQKRKSLGIPMRPVPKIEMAELSKIIENAHRYLQIAFAEDLYLYCQANNINFPELRDALNTKWNVEILEPREGIGGHCLPKDTKMFLESSNRRPSKILAAAMEVDRDYRRLRPNREIKNPIATYSSPRNCIPYSFR